MSDIDRVIGLLEQRAERGDPLGANEVLRRARESFEGGDTRLPGRPIRSPMRRRVVLAVIVLIVLVAGAALAVARSDPPSHQRVAAGDTSGTGRTADTGDTLAWVDGRGPVLGRPDSAAQRRVGVTGQWCQSCPSVAAGNAVFTTQGSNVVKIDVRAERVTEFAKGNLVFAGPGDGTLYVGSSSRDSRERVRKLSLDGARVGGERTVRPVIRSTPRLALSRGAYSYAPTRTNPTGHSQSGTPAEGQ